MSYEELLNEPTTALKTVVSAIGLSATPAALHKIQELTTASKLQSDRTINMRSVGNSPKIRSAGLKNYTQYGLSACIIGWMDHWWQAATPRPVAGSAP